MVNPRVEGPHRVDVHHEGLGPAGEVDVVVVIRVILSGPRSSIADPQITPVTQLLAHSRTVLSLLEMGGNMLAIRVLAWARLYPLPDGFT
jgi:hypothetical protein